MTMLNSTSMMAPAESTSMITRIRQIFALGDLIPLSVVQLAARVAVAHVFWKSAQSKLASWPVTQQLFAMEYHVPLIPPEIAASLATVTELAGAVLVFFGLLTRLGALALLGVVTVIQLFVYPGNWGEHLLWASLLLLLIARGAGVVSLDYLVSRVAGGR
jgi:putative oxidoreductase